MNAMYSFALDPSQITNYLNYALYGIFGLVAFGFIRGFMRGVWREGFRLVFVGGLVIASVLFTRQIVAFFMDFDFTSIAANAGFGNLSINFGSTAILVPVTTPFQTISQVLEQALLSVGVTMTAEISDLVIGITLVLLRYLVFIFLAIVIFFLGEPLAGLLYFFPFRFIIPRHIRAKVKLRLLGGLAGAAKVGLVLAMFLSPFTSLINTISTSFKNFDDQYGEEIDGELYNQIMAYINAYGDSQFAQTLFNWSLDENGLTIDTRLMDYVTGQDIENYRLTLANELGSMVDIAGTLIGSGALDATFSSVDASLLLTENVITNMVAAITSSTLIMKILPIVAVIALNMDEVQSYVDPSLINLDAVNWEDELINFGDILKGVVRSGILAPILDGDPNAVIPLLFTETAATEMVPLLTQLDDSELMSQLVPAVLYGLAQQELSQGIPEGEIGISTFLPTDWEDYQNLQIGHELALVYEILYDLGTQVEGFYDVLINSFGSSTPEPTPLLSRLQEGEPTPTPSIIDLLRDHFDIFVEVMIGEVDEEGYPKNNDPVTGKSINRNSLFDSNLLVLALPQLMDQLIVPRLVGLAGENFDDSGLIALVEELNNGTEGDIRLEYKEEFSGMFAILGAVLKSEALAPLLEPEEGSSVDLLSLLTDDAFRLSLKTDLIPTFDRSGIVLEIVPGFLEATLTGAGFGDFLGQLSLTSEDLNFDFSSLSRELGIVVDMLGYAVNVLDASEDLVNQFPTLADDLIGFLDQMYLSDIINLNPVTNNKTTNYQKIIKGVFTLIESVGVEESDLDYGFGQVSPIGENDGWTTVYTDTNGNGRFDDEDTITFAGENYHLVNFLKETLASGILDISGDLFTALNALTSGTEDLEDENVAILYKVFALAERSKLISASFGGILDNLFGTTGALLDEEIGSSFRNVTSWEEEGSNILFLVKQLANFQDGLANLDFLNSDLTLVEELLQGLAASQIFDGENDTYLFPAYLLKQLQGITSLSEFFKDPNPYLSQYDSDPADLYTIIKQDFANVGNTLATRENWYGVKTLITDVNNDPILDGNGDLQYQYIGGEIENILAFIEGVQDVPIAGLTDGSSLTSTTIESMLISLNDAPSLRVLLFNIYNDIFSGPGFDIGPLSLADSNTYVFLELNQSGREDQIYATADLLDLISEVGLSNGGSFDLNTFTAQTIGKIGDLLDSLHDSALFNSFKIGNSRALSDLTVFEQVYQFLLTSSTLDRNIYASSPTEQDRLNLLYEDLSNLDNNFGDGSPDQWSGINGEINRFVNVMTALIDLGLDFSQFSSGSSSSNFLITLINDPNGGSTKVENLLLALNRSTIIYPSVRNLFLTSLTEAQINAISSKGLRDDPSVQPPLGNPYIPYLDQEIIDLVDFLEFISSAPAVQPPMLIHAPNQPKQAADFHTLFDFLLSKKDFIVINERPISVVRS